MALWNAKEIEAFKREAEAQGTKVTSVRPGDSGMKPFMLVLFIPGNTNITPLIKKWDDIADARTNAEQKV